MSEKVPKQRKQIRVRLYSSINKTTRRGGTAITDGVLFDDGNPKNLDIWNASILWRADWLAGSAQTRALSGFIRQNLGGFRADINISLRNTSIDQTEAIWGLLNDIHYTDAGVARSQPAYIGISPTSSITQEIMCALNSSFVGIRHDLTIGRQMLNLQLVGVFRQPMPQSTILERVIST